MNQKRVGVVVNPVSDSEAADEFIALLRESFEVEVLETTEDDPGMSMAAQLVGDGFPVIVAAGGDGTVRACAESIAGTDVTLAVFPLGTGNLLAANLDLPAAPDDVVAAIADGEDVTIDVGRVNGEVFTIMTGFGLDATIMEDTDSETKDKLGALAYVMTALGHLHDDPISAKISIGGQRPEELDVATCLVGNMGKILGSIDVFPDARYDDAKFDVLAITADGVMAWTAAARESMSDSGGEHVSRWVSDRVLIEFDKPQEYELDGEARPKTDRLEIEIVPRSLTVRKART